MKILIVGSSLVNSESWAHMLKNSSTHDIDIHQFNGGGNEIISHTIMNHYEDYDAFINVWSPTDGVDILYSDRRKIKLHSGQSAQTKDGKNLWVHSAGWSGSWHVDSTDGVFRSYYKNQFDAEDSWQKTLARILVVHKLISNKPHLDMFSHNTLERISFGMHDKNSLKEYDKEKWKSFKEQTQWVKLIDWSSFWFHSNEVSNTGGIMDWCHDNTSDDGLHPSVQGHEQFLNNIIKPWINNLNE